MSVFAFGSKPFLKKGTPIKKRIDEMPYWIIRKQPVRKTPYPQHTIHFQTKKNEKQAIIKLRRLGGYSVHHLATVLGRSTAYVWKTIKREEAYGTLKDQKKKLVKDAVRKLTSKANLKKLWGWLPLWEPYIYGEEGEPP